MSRISNSGSKPKLACEIAADRVLVGRISDIGGRTIEANLRQPDAVYETIRDTLGSVGARSRDVIAVLPDAAVRVVLLDFETLPPKREEAESVVRFRLKKSLPFDVDKAKVSYHVQSSKGGVRVIAAVALNNVVEDYEAVFRQAGYEPGVVLPSMLAALGAADAPKPSLIIKVDARTTSIAILDRDQLLLFRTLENTRGVTVTGEQLAEEVYPSVVFFQDTYQMNIGQIFVAGLPESGNAAPALRAQTGADVKDLVSPSQLSGGVGSIPKWRMAGVVGALLS
jgi:type IV pilus assembly protein PilM